MFPQLPVMLGRPGGTVVIRGDLRARQRRAPRHDLGRTRRQLPAHDLARIGIDIGIDRTPLGRAGVHMLLVKRVIRFHTMASACSVLDQVTARPHGIARRGVHYRLRWRRLTVFTRSTIDRASASTKRAAMSQRESELIVMLLNRKRPNATSTPTAIPR